MYGFILDQLILNPSSRTRNTPSRQCCSARYAAARLPKQAEEATDIIETEEAIDNPENEELQVMRSQNPLRIWKHEIKLPEVIFGDILEVIFGHKATEPASK